MKTGGGVGGFRECVPVCVSVAEEIGVTCRR